MIEFKNPTKYDIVKGLFLRHVLKQDVVIWHGTNERIFMRTNWLCRIIRWF